MQKILILPAILAAVAVVGLAYANSGNFHLGPLQNANTICSTSPITLSSNTLSNTVVSSATCGNWTVTLSSIIKGENDDNGANVSVALLSVYYNQNSTDRDLLRTVMIEQNQTRGVCFHIGDENLRADEGVGRSHTCLVINASSVTSTSATITLRGITFMRHPEGDGANEANNQSDENQGNHLGSIRSHDGQGQDE